MPRISRHGQARWQENERTNTFLASQIWEPFLLEFAERKGLSLSLLLTVDLEVDDGGEGIVDAVLRLAEVPPLVVLLDLEQETNRKEIENVENYGEGLDK